MGKSLTSFENGPASRPLCSEAASSRARRDKRPFNGWTELLSQAIESEILPRICSAQRQGELNADQSGILERKDIARFVDLIIADDMEQASEMVDEVIVRAGGRVALLNDLLTPAARLLGEMWERDICDFMTVTLGVIRLDQIMRETARLGDVKPAAAGFENRILLLPAPGEQHSFGVGMVADAFREAGWCVRSGPAVSRAKLLHLVRDEWFDIIGLSITSERWLKGLPACIRAVRLASCNPGACLMVGGYAISHHPERTRFLGADLTACSAGDAVLQGNQFMESTVTQRLQPSRARLVDAG